MTWFQEDNVEQRSRMGRLNIHEKLMHISWMMIFVICLIASVGFAMLYSAADGLRPWAQPQMIRFGMGMVVLLAVAVIDIRWWMRISYWFYVICLVLLVVVEFKGHIGMGAQRWINLGFMRLQPSELMKIALILALARYFHSSSLDDVRSIRHLFIPLLLIALPAIFVLRQPDLGTTLMLVVAGAVVFFLSGVQLWKFGVVIGLGAASIPVAWQFLHQYQKNRVLTFLDPERDPLGTGYHIIQSKIALGSGGFFGKGLQQGTQSQLNFLPEKQTDFIFTMLGEETGMVGGLALIFLYVVLLILCYAIAARIRNQFGRLMSIALLTNFFLYVFINIAMVMGLLPVVGVPLPLVSYGGTAMLTLLFGFGLIMSAYVHKDVPMGLRSAYQ
jgi:rod shape determining protein RodA